MPGKFGSITETHPAQVDIFISLKNLLKLLLVKRSADDLDRPIRVVCFRVDSFAMLKFVKTSDPGLHSLNRSQL